MYYTPHALPEILSKARPAWVKKDGNIIMNEAISFDIETTSTYINKEKVAFMYVWMFDIFDKTIIGRTWAEFKMCMEHICNFYKLSGIKRRMIVYVHNLAYEFQFIRKWFSWTKVFSLSRRKPLYALTTTGIEFRCSYRLSGYKLETIGEQIGIEKLPDFDYRKIRHWKTELTTRELEYCVHDVKIVSAYIRQKMREDDNNISQIPLTKTGYVRRYVRNRTLRGSNRCFYKNAIQALTIEPEEYLMCKRAFAGGFTHAAILHSGKEMRDVTSFDFSSSYPTVLIAEKYPMVKGVHIGKPSQKQFEELMRREECCVFTIEIANLEQKFPCESYLSQSRCRKVKNAIVNNGRIYSADYLITDMTSVDYNIMKQVYKFDVTGVDHLYYYEKYYLPTSFVECILHFYNVKTKLKGVAGKEEEYMNGKENLNALFGMCVTDIVRELIEYDTDAGWLPPDKMDDDEYLEFVSNQLDKENSKKSRFLYYLWGVFCTAYARKNLWTGILECKSDYIYSDTDSVKILNYEKHKPYFDAYNKDIIAKLERALDYHHMSHDLIRPKNIKGDEKILGIWDFDGHYDSFKAVRAKSYMYCTDGEYHMTVAGLSKQNAVKYLTSEKAKKAYFIETNTEPHSITPLDIFRDGMYIPADYTGKLTHTYIDDEFRYKVYDFRGVEAIVSERSFIHLEPADFHLSIARVYSEFLKGHQPDEYK